MIKLGFRGKHAYCLCIGIEKFIFVNFYWKECKKMFVIYTNNNNNLTQSKTWMVCITSPLKTKLFKLIYKKIRLNPRTIFKNCVLFLIVSKIQWIKSDICIPHSEQWSNREMRSTEVVGVAFSLTFSNKFHMSNAYFVYKTICIEWTDCVKLILNKIFLSNSEWVVWLCNAKLFCTTMWCIL